MLYLTNQQINGFTDVTQIFMMVINHTLNHIKQEMYGNQLMIMKKIMMNQKIGMKETNMVILTDFINHPTIPHNFNS